MVWFPGSQLLGLLTICGHRAELELKALSLYLCVDQSTWFFCAHGRNCYLRLLDIMNHVYEVMEFGVHQGTIVALAIAQLHFGGNLRGAIILLDGSTTSDLDLLTCGFYATANVVLGVVFVEEIIHDLL